MIFERAASISLRRYSTLLNNSDKDETPLNGSMMSSTNNSNNNGGDASKWEEMYFQGESRRQTMIGSDNDKSVVISAASTVRVVSFDLDNCLWRTSAVIDGANQALAAHLEAEGIQQPVQTEVVMRELFKANKAQYAPLAGDKAKGPVNLTQLRQDAIQHILQQHNGYNETGARNKALEYFQVWTEARHEAITTNLATNVQETLTRIRDILTSASGQPVVMGAITDGNSDPTRVNLLRPFFDFCVNAESVGVGKPDARLFLEAMQQVVPTLDDVQFSVTEDQVGPWWVHVGDDFVKDVVAGKGMGMRTVWARELVKDNVAKAVAAKPNPDERSVQDFVKQVSAQKVVQMQVGAEDYLAESLRDEFADAVIDSFDDLPDILLEWHSQGLKRQTEYTNSESAINDDSPLEIFMPDKAPARKERPSKKAVQATGKKFCFYCGEQLPPVAKFCSSCGEEQPVLD